MNSHSSISPVNCRFTSERIVSVNRFESIVGIGDGSGDSPAVSGSLMIPQRKETRYHVLPVQITTPAGLLIADVAHGKGLFAVRDFNRGHRVGWMEGQVIQDEWHSSDYCVDLGDGNSLEPGVPFRYLNHSCEPNCELYLIETDKEGNTYPVPRVSVETTRSISVGEELTIDYGWPAEQAIPCGCGAKECRGWVVAEEELHLVGKRSRKTAI